MSTTRRPAWTIALCWAAIMLDGFDAVVLGAIIPPMLDDAVFGLTKADATTVATLGLVGMMIGALVMGRLTDVWGRRRMLMAAVAVFSLLTGLSALAPSPLVLMMLRLLAGIGLGGALPIAIALVTEASPAHRRSVATTVVMTGYHTGAVLTAAAGAWALGSIGWRGMWLLGAAPALVLLPLLWWRLPESDAYLAARSAPTERVGLGTFLGPRYRRLSVTTWVASFMGLLLVYGLNTWLPQIMRESGYELGTALQLFLVLNAGGIVGLLVAGRVAEAIGSRSAAVAWFVGAAALLGLLAIKMPTLALFVAVFLTGAFVFSAQVLVYAFTSAAYPSELRATAVGMSAGIGRLGAISGPLLAGVLVTTGYVYPWGFYAFAAVGALAVIALLLTPRLAR